MTFTNHLAESNSPYLKQHAHNPVNWYPWGKEALEKALKENKPILLSIGYAACHWCHVMAHESFEDEETAKLMNEFFINIKVDREERPDLDKIYQTTHYLLTQQSGGWPLTVFLTPDLIPYFSGTYFPKESKYQLPAFKDLLKLLANAYHNQKEDIQTQSEKLVAYLNQTSSLKTAKLNESPLALALKQFEKNFDKVHGGFGHAPKFPQAPKLLFLLNQGSEIAKFTLAKMAGAGINDQLSGGFFRYTVDEKWEIPHFEKMLYDNAQLLTLYAKATELYPHSQFEKNLKETAYWLDKTLKDKNGGFYSSLDADSAGHEGLYYIWKKDEVKSLLTDKEFSVVSLYFGLDKTPNFEGYFHFYIATPIQLVADTLALPLSETENLLENAKKKLLLAREKRKAPALDNKILTSSNSLVILGLLHAGSILEDKYLLDSALSTLCFIQEKMWKNERLFASYYQGKVSLSAYLDDYAFLSKAILQALQINWRDEYLTFLQQLLDILLKHFYDELHGGFYFTANDHPTPLYRPKTLLDEATPNGNGILVEVLLIMGELLNETRYLEAAQKTLQAAWPLLETYPSEHVSLLTGLTHYLNLPEFIVIRGPKEEIKKWHKALKTPKNYVFAIPDDAILPLALKDKKLKGKICAYVCRKNTCKEIINNLDELKKTLS